MFLNEDIFDTINDEENAFEGPGTGINNGISDLLLSLINEENNTIRDYNNFIVNLDSHPEFIPVIEDITNEEMKHVGQLQTLLSKISPNVEEIENGKEEAEEQLNESMSSVSWIDQYSIEEQAGIVVDYLNRFVTYALKDSDIYTDAEIEKFDEVIDLLYRVSNLNESLLQEIHADNEFIKQAYGIDVYNALQEYCEEGHNLGDVLYKYSEWEKFEKYCEDNGVKIKKLNEDIQNLERVMKSERVDAVGSMPITMLDAVEESEKVQDDIEKEMEEHSEKVKLNKVIGAEKQPVPDMPEIPKLTLDESLFDDFDSTKLNEGIIKRYSDVQPEEVKNRGWWYFTTHGVQPGSIPDDLNVLEIRDGVNSAGVEGTFVRLDGILNTFELKDYDMKEEPPINEKLLVEKDAEDYTVYALVSQELCPEHGNFRRLTKFPEVKFKDRYNVEDLGIEYNKDGFVDLTIIRDFEDEFDFARAVANAYDVEFIGPIPEGPNQFKAKIRISEEDM